MSNDYFLNVAETALPTTASKQDVENLAVSFSNMYSAGYNNARNGVKRRKPYISNEKFLMEKAYSLDRKYKHKLCSHEIEVKSINQFSHLYCGKCEKYDEVSEFTKKYF